MSQTYNSGPSLPLKQISVFVLAVAALLILVVLGAGATTAPAATTTNASTAPAAPDLSLQGWGERTAVIPSSRPLQVVAAFQPAHLVSNYKPPRCGEKDTGPNATLLGAHDYMGALYLIWQCGPAKYFTEEFHWRGPGSPPSLPAMP